MSPWDTNSLDHHHRRQDHRHPSFSSTLLDQIYNSIDDSSTNSDVSMRKKQNRAASLDENRVCLENILVNRRKTAGDSVRSRNLKTVEPVFFKHSSSSSSSDSSGFSSSESDSFYRRTRSSPAIHHPKPVRTTVERLERPNSNKVKSKALKMYSDLKKVKQPISPGGRLATFLNSIFTGNAKKPNKTKTAATSSSTTCSSASSFSRSCLSNKTTSSSEKSKRSVRFCPVNVLLDEDSKRSGHKTHNIHNGLYGSNERESTRHLQNFDTIESRVMEENRRVIEAAKELIRTYQKNKDVVKLSVEDDDDGASCASSDLFELDHLSVIGIDRYREELPVYETTRFNTSRIISR
ncbi:Protein BIG GRAIN 1-like B [Hirschfeldia incana]|nr:Protein BIG GRAIN 1-like B [Hirschfeldia incana]